MTPDSLALVLLITFLAVTILDWLVQPMKRTVVVVVVLLLAFLWVYGVPVIVARRGG